MIQEYKYLTADLIKHITCTHYEKIANIYHLFHLLYLYQILNVHTYTCLGSDTICIFNDNISDCVVVWFSMAFAWILVISEIWRCKHLIFFNVRIMLFSKLKIRNIYTYVDILSVNTSHLKYRCHEITMYYKIIFYKARPETMSNVISI